jgi:Inner membrane protein YgaP-like, transmembrane domain
MNSVLGFLASMNGRIVRAVAGIVLIVLGLFLVHGIGGWILAIIGLVPLAAGVFDFCVFAPLFGKPFQGKDLREATKK